MMNVQNCTVATNVVFAPQIFSCLEFGLETQDQK